MPRLIELQAVDEHVAALPSHERTGHRPVRVDLAHVLRIETAGLGDGAVRFVTDRGDVVADLHASDSLAVSGEAEPGEVDKLGAVARLVADAAPDDRERIASGDRLGRTTR
ncbi:MAG: hypothetical protein IH944_14630 [Armatimonadetes bacterium]|nr:hypothetical protein [Armatimonadota bacterium]